mmetsp:Transcript_8262/g.24976  ORF Transcript_8262/g.24976 Transcript_8262/m.24976 type:complete len:122 (+) Transcript_8262:507-872(+)
MDQLAAPAAPAVAAAAAAAVAAAAAQAVATETDVVVVWDVKEWATAVVGTVGAQAAVQRVASVVVAGALKAAAQVVVIRVDMEVATAVVLGGSWAVVNGLTEEMEAVWGKKVVLTAEVELA